MRQERGPDLTIGITETEVGLIRASWAEAAADPSTAARLFYGRLFQENPDMKALFGSDMTEQGQKLMDTINFVVDHLDDLDALAKPVTELGIRHRGYGVTPNDYGPVGGALIWTFQHLLGDRFSQDMEGAWTKVYMHLAQTMTSTTA